MKDCARCKETKPIEEFASLKQRGGRPDSYCRPCRSALSRDWHRRNPEPTKAKRAWERDNPEKVTFYNRKSRYGVDHMTFKVMRMMQRGGCFICGAKDVDLCIDHDHGTGDVRALLCRTCNTGLGMFRDSPELLKAAARYLEVFADLSTRDAS